MDLNCGYWQVTIENKDKTAFITPYDPYHFLGYDFWTPKAPLRIQGLMEIL